MSVREAKSKKRKLLTCSIITLGISSAVGSLMSLLLLLAVSSLGGAGGSLFPVIIVATVIVPALFTTGCIYALRARSADQRDRHDRHARLAEEAEEAATPVPNQNNTKQRNVKYSLLAFGSSSLLGLVGLLVLFMTTGGFIFFILPIFIFFLTVCMYTTIVHFDCSSPFVRH